MTLLQRWRRWRRWRALRWRRYYGGEFGSFAYLLDRIRADDHRRYWRRVLLAERTSAEADRRRRMRGGYDVPGVP